MSLLPIDRNQHTHPLDHIGGWVGSLAGLGIIYGLVKYFEKRKQKKMKGDVQRVFGDYMRSQTHYNPVTRRALSLEQMYNEIPDGDSAEDDGSERDGRTTLQQRLYANPGRQYPYLNGVSGDERSREGLKRKVGSALGYTVREGWPVIGAGAGWWFANRWYKGQIAKGLTGRLKDSFKRRWWEYLVPGIGSGKVAADTGAAMAKEGALKFWSFAKMPLLYAIGAYAAYKTIGYFIKRRREKKLNEREVERFENLRREMLMQNRALVPQELPA